MKVRKSIIGRLRKHNGKAEVTKALALVLFYQMRVLSDQSKCNADGMTACRVKDFSYNKLRNITGLHINTIKKRIATALRTGWVVQSGSDLLIDNKRIRSSHGRNNYSIDNGISNIKDLQDYLLAHIVINIQECKDYAKDVFGKLKRPTNLKDYKKARKDARERYPMKDKYSGDGVSYGCIASNAGVCRTKAIQVVLFAERSGLIRRIRRIRQENEKTLQEYRKMERYDILSEYLHNKFGRVVRYFFTQSNLYVCLANSYCLPTGNY